ncbi:Gfo/Idh/MocA family oxidoreductase [Gilvimarinus sp. SDUM040013]|uniref:Gfo/Idh/MocA family oxidoreductase n=1 Tax=Gilvimarinus gilvus TaxID=3058038 RepID=A0ABU4S0Q8_9GAMM|nr:Gfo/Idh/MocA family oxidoreductase [Gilvimarinus sp. SDUM040013]MDO3384578.1 Gfo/Idh/MocA family oxidoreductase [Gilvimarinus sp. SDUM040013]MDX6850086.1 Gfo/Idh/MocA family oxidoreductase [Gilvimarinus sp. SDUM040013]
MNINKSSRRQFIKRMGLGSAVLTGVSSSHLWAAPQRKLGVALVGLGYYSRDLLAPALQLTQHCELRGIVTGSPEKIPVWQKKYGIKDANVYNYDNMHTIANNPDIDVIYIVVPTGLHLKYSVIAANAGKHVWCEKPMAMDATECQTIIDTCRKNKVKLSIGYRMQHEPNTQTVIQYAKSLPYGDIGSVTSTAAYAGNGAAADYWRMQAAMGGGALYDMGVYAINGARYATGMEPVAVTAKRDFSHPKFNEVDNTTTLTLEFPGEVIAKCRTSVVESGNVLRVDCADGWYQLSPMQAYNNVTGTTSDGKTLDKFIANQQAAQMDNDALAILNNSQVIVPGEDGKRDIEIVQAAIESSAKNQRVTLT